jgi:hypothetical protein
MLPQWKADKHQRTFGNGSALRVQEAPPRFRSEVNAQITFWELPRRLSSQPSAIFLQLLKTTTAGFIINRRAA